MRGLDFGYEMVGLVEGWRGLMEMKTTPLSLEVVDGIISQGGTILGSSRTNPFKSEDTAKVAGENFKKLGLDALIAIGGDDTLGAANKLFKAGFNTVGVPKTMDNDLSCTDYTFGFDSAVSVAVDAIDRLRDTARSHRRIIVVEVMGRHAGWVALWSGIASDADWILIPEVPADMNAMCAHLKGLGNRGKQWGIVVVSEGVVLDPSQADGIEKDDFGNIAHLAGQDLAKTIADYVKQATGIDTRHAVLGHIVRGGSPTIFDRVLGTRVGVKAAEMVEAGDWGKMAALQGNDVVAVPLDKAVGVSKTVPPELYDLAKIFFK
jgi:6-phosphofructokinase 1